MNQQSFPPQAQSSFNSMQDLNKGLLALNLDSKTLKKLGQSGIKEFIPQQTMPMKNTDISRFQTNIQVMKKDAVLSYYKFILLTAATATTSTPQTPQWPSFFWLSERQTFGFCIEYSSTVHAWNQP